MRTESSALALAALGLVSCQPEPARLSITDVRAVATGEMASAYFTIGNSGGADRLVRVEAPDTGEASLHEMSMNQGVMRMRPANGGFVIPAGEGIILAPQGRHVMIMANRKIPIGTKMPMVLYFERHQPMALAVPVEGPELDEGDGQ